MNHAHEKRAFQKQMFQFFVLAKANFINIQAFGYFLNGKNKAQRLIIVYICYVLA